jgi:hypothetical protein
MGAAETTERSEVHPTPSAVADLDGDVEFLTFGRVAERLKAHAWRACGQ